MSSEKHKQEVNDKLDSQEFYELMQAYRCAPMTNQALVCKSFEDVKEYIKRLEE